MGEPNHTNKPQRSDDEEWHWIEPVTQIAASLGLNPVRVRWKLRAVQNRWNRSKRRMTQRAEHIRYQHKTCRECGAVQDHAAKLCTSCGERLTSRTWQMLQRIGVRSPQLLSMSSLLGTALVIIYGRMIFATTTGDYFSFDAQLLIRFGGTWAPAIESGQWWRYTTAIFLHAGLWHLGFNLIALTIIGPPVEELYGRLQTLFAFMLTGILANVGSHLISPAGSASALRARYSGLSASPPVGVNARGLATVVSCATR